MFERILIPLDGTEIAEVAIPYVEELASKFGSEVILYHTYGREYREHDSWGTECDKKQGVNCLNEHWERRYSGDVGLSPGTI